ncbi:hypothetical protein RS694_05895 [Rhodoferax saidenbachensis]|uniref:Uncharacterized protein n=2 Tax=Rhodoferax saidenbachensis TaxID=1484693 RepID=A0A1P8K7Y2_9BURK|nr:hypothetical protein RS694_05895 [Rhodoferax saidenbachensis]
MAQENEVFILPGGQTIVTPAFRVYVATGYKPSEKNIEFLKSLKEKIPEMQLVTFDAAKDNRNMLLCRGSFPVYGPNKTPFSSLMEAALNMELVASGVTNENSARIQATLDEFDFSSFGGGAWKMSATFSAPGKASFSVKNEYTFPVSFKAVTGCGEIMKAMETGIESFLSKVYSTPGFVALMQ